MAATSPETDHRSGTRTRSGIRTRTRPRVAFRRRTAEGPDAVGVLRYAAGGGRAGLTALLLAGLADAAVTLALPAVLGHTLDLLLSGGRPHAWLAACAALAAAEVLLGGGTALLTGTANARATARLRRRCSTHLLDTGTRAAARLTPGELVTRLGAHATEAGTGPAAAASTLAALLYPVGGLVALAVVDPWLALVFAAGLPLLVGLLRAFTRGSAASVAAYQREQGRIAAYLMEALEGARTVAAAGTAARERDRVLAPLPVLRTHGYRMWQLYGRAMAHSSVLAPLLTTAVLAAGGLRLAAGQLTVGGLLAAARYAAMAAGVGAVAGRFDALARAYAAAGRLAELLAVPAVAHGSRRLPPGGPGRLELRGVDVVRDGTPVLRGVDLTVPGGNTVALVGRSGAGKSTLAAVAGRLLDPDGGEVTLDGVPLPALDRRELRTEIGYAFERPALFGATVRTALAFGAHAAPHTEVVAAARTAGADGFVRRLPLGYHTPLADAPLSGGELQRLGLARAFAHSGRLLILDDATSSLDSVTEYEVERALARRTRAGTRLLVAHRVSGAARADLVAWLEDGRVRAVAPHAVLWAEPAYRAVFAAADGGADASGDPGGADGPGGPDAAARPECR
ncbi:ABC transporter ATP-binding protein [Streptomyces phytohabitans]|uniref:ABC transporter ATP-binding protein n=1 Tax=Streptomyces phytohabitans TaxID=1150371 RepID=UPI00345BCABD